MKFDLHVEIDRAIRRALARQPSRRKTAVVTGLDPLTVRFASDTADTQVAQKRDDYSPGMNDTVVLERVGPTDDASSTWVAVYSIEEL